MQLSPRPTRIPLTCPCGARLSVIPRLQGTEVKCPRCQEALLVPGVPIETSAAVVASRPEVSSTKVDAPFHQLDLTSNYESSVQHTHVESVPYIVASNGVQSSNTRDEEIRIPGNDQATAETTVEPFRGIAGIPSPPDFASTDDRDLFGSLNESEAAHMNSFLSETIPRTCRTLIGLSGYRNTLNHIEQLRKACKVKRVPLSGGQAGWIIDPDWLKSVGNNSPSAGVADPTTKQTPLQLPRTLFPVPRESASYVKPDNAVVLPASSGRSELTSSQKRVFDVVESSYALKGISPTIQELQTATSLNRFETFNEVDALVRKGLFEFDRSEARGIRIIPEAERVVPPSVVEASIVFSPLLAASLQDIPQSVANLAPAFASQNPAKVSDVVVASDDDSAATQVAPVQAIPIWLEPFLTSALLDRQFEFAGRRVPPREQIKALVLSMANRGFTIHRETLCQTLGLPAIRYPGFLSIVMRLFNVDNVPILTRDDDGEMVRLNVDLLCRQFQITRP